MVPGLIAIGALRTTLVQLLRTPNLSNLALVIVSVGFWILISLAAQADDEADDENDEKERRPVRKPAGKTAGKRPRARKAGRKK